MIPLGVGSRLGDHTREYTRFFLSEEQVSEEIEELKRNIAKYEKLVETATHAEKLILLENLLEMRKEKNLLLREQCEQSSVDAWSISCQLWPMQ